MRHFILTTIIALAAAKAKSQANEKLDRQQVRKKPVGRQQLKEKREGLNNGAGHSVNLQKG
ncbi:hypothetical protein D1AOALGA4SA_12832 [Olavius algarvensis Delta 1 endosymbiont]|nr:hypothetical protein D1AOALGA4SA_12832 [Olavius algarvensis Delta 1 endosymbiont]